MSTTTSSDIQEECAFVFLGELRATLSCFFFYKLVLIPHCNKQMGTNGILLSRLRPYGTSEEVSRVTHSRTVAVSVPVPALEAASEVSDAGLASLGYQVHQVVLDDPQRTRERQQT